MGYSPIAQINGSFDFDESGKIIRQNCLINIREESVSAAYEQYVELRELVLNGNGEEKVHENGEEKIAEISSDSMICDDCGQELILRSGSRGFFWGCSGYPQCRNTKPATATTSKLDTNNSAMRTDRQENDSSPIPNCPRHNVKMLLRSRKSDGELFFGCSLFNRDGCLETVQYPMPRKATVKVPSVAF